MNLGKVPYDLIIPGLIFQKTIIKSPQFTHLAFILINYIITGENNQVVEVIILSTSFEVFHRFPTRNCAFYRFKAENSASVFVFPAVEKRKKYTGVFCRWTWKKSPEGADRPLLSPILKMWCRKTASGICRFTWRCFFDTTRKISILPAVICTAGGIFIFGLKPRSCVFRGLPYILGQTSLNLITP